MKKTLLLYLFSLASLLCFSCTPQSPPTGLEIVEPPGNIIEQIEDATLGAAIKLVAGVRGEAIKLRKEARELRKKADQAAKEEKKAVKKKVHT